MNNYTTLHKSIAGRTVSITAEVIAIEDTHISLLFRNEWDALVACHCYQGQRSKIETTADGGYLAVIYFNTPAA